MLNASSRVGIFPIIIWLSLALAGLSFLTMCAVILHRAIKTRHDHSVELRSRTLMNLGLECIENPDSLPKLQAQLQPSDQQLLVRLFAELLQKVRGDYAGRMVDFMRDLGLRDRCVERLRSRFASQRAEACSLLGVFGDPAVLSALERMLDDESVDVRIEAARALAKHGAIRSVDQILDKLAIGTETRSLSALDIFRSLNRDAVPELIRVLETSNREAVNLLAVDALSHIGDLRAVPAMLKLMRAPILLAGPAAAVSAPAKPEPATGDMRQAVQDSNRLQRRALPEPRRRRRTRSISTNLQLAIVQALSRLDDPRALPGIIAALDDPAAEVRAQAALCAGNLGSIEAVPVLEKLLRDENWWVRYHAAEALFKLGESGLGSLWAATQSPVARTADMAQGLLREKGLSA